MHERNLTRRGHLFLPPDLAANIPALYATEDVPMLEKVVHAHYFVGVCDWWIFELDPEESRAFGFVCLGDEYSAEAGYIWLPEVEGLVLPVESEERGKTVPLALVVERDLGWVPRPVRDAIPERLHPYWWKPET